MFRRGISGKWKDKKDVCYISSEYDDTMLNVASKRRVIRKKPLPIIRYNTSMAGVDTLDQLLSYYPREQKLEGDREKFSFITFKWWVINAHRLCNKSFDKKMNLCDFRIAVIIKMLPIPTLVLENKPKFDAHYLVKREEKTSSGKIKGKVCKMHYKTSDRTDTIYVCQKCSLFSFFACAFAFLGGPTNSIFSFP